MPLEDYHAEGVYVPVMAPGYPIALWGIVVRSLYVREGIVVQVGSASFKAAELNLELRLLMDQHCTWFYASVSYAVIL